MIERSIVHLPNLVKDIDRPVSIYLVHLSSISLPRVGSIYSLEGTEGRLRNGHLAEALIYWQS